MRPKYLLLLSIAFVVLGFAILIIGGIMLATSTKHPTTNQNGAVVLRISGRVACIFGGLLIASTLVTCLYLCISDAPYATSDLYEAPVMSQLEKAIKPTNNKSILRTSGMETRDHRWAENEKSSNSNRLQKTVRLQHYSPSGDTFERDADSQFSDKPWRDTHNSRNLGDKYRMQYAAQGFPHLSRRHRRCQSLDTSTSAFSCIPESQSQMNSYKFSSGTRDRLWIPTLEDASTSAFSATDPISAELFGRQVEPLGSMLHRGGHVKLGTPYA